MAAKSTTVLTKEALEASGYTVEKVEYWMSFGGRGGVRKDLLGGIDILAIRGAETLGVQATSKSNVSARVKKILAEPRLEQWLTGGTRSLQVWGWEGKELRVVDIRLEDYEKARRAA